MPGSARDRLPAYFDGANIYWKGFRELRMEYPYSVHLADILERRPSINERLRAHMWAFDNNLDYDWYGDRLYFKKSKDAALFKMGIWAVPPSTF